MKKLKIKKRMTSFLMLAVMVISFIGVMPTAKVHAGTFLSLETTELDDEGNPIVYKGSTEHDVYQFQAPGHSDVSMICVYSPYEHGSRLIYIFLSEDRDFTSVKVNCASDNGDIANYTITEHGTVSNNIKSYNYVYSEFIGGHYDFKFNAITKVTTAEEIDSHGPEQSKYVKYYVDNFVNYGDEWATIDGNPELVPDGSSTDPIRDKSVGYPDIYDYKFLITSPSTHGEDGKHGEWDKLKNADYIKWKSKSTTGFNLTSPDSKYKNVYIQAKIVSRFQYNDSFWGNGEWHNYDNYGEEGYFDFINPSDKELTVTFQQLTELLPKTHAENHHFKKYNFDYDYYFRIVYMRADDLKVIPTYYSGGWRRISCHSNNGKHDENGEGENSSAIITDGDDEGGKWKTDEDSKDNDKNIDNGTGEGSDLDDAKDDANNKKKDTSSGSLDIDSVKGFMNDVGNVPKAIGKLFSFLPDWVTTFIGFGFVVLVALMIIKAIRG